MQTLVVAVVGPLGAGKTTFIENMIQRKPKPIPTSQRPVFVSGESSSSPSSPPPLREITDVYMYTYDLLTGETPFILIDTPGLSTDAVPDHETINAIKSRIEGTGLQLNGIIYLQRITDSEASDAAVRNIRALCDKFSSSSSSINGFRHVIFGTTFWDAVADIVGERCERYFLAELQDRLGLSTQQTVRLGNTANSSVALLESFGLGFDVRQISRRAARRIKEEVDAECARGASGIVEETPFMWSEEDEAMFQRWATWEEEKMWEEWEREMESDDDGEEGEDDEENEYDEEGEYDDEEDEYDDEEDEYGDEEEDDDDSISWEFSSQGSYIKVTTEDLDTQHDSSSTSSTSPRLDQSVPDAEVDTVASEQARRNDGARSCAMM